MGMLLHVTPRIFSSSTQVQVEDVVVDVLGRRFSLGKEIAAGHPYPNKRYCVVGPSNPTGKAYSGLLIEVAQPPVEFTVDTVWTLGGHGMVRHSVLYKVLDHEFDAITDDMLLWGERWPEERRGEIPCQARPRFEHTGEAFERVQEFACPSLPRNVLAEPLSLAHRTPPADMTFSLA